MVVFLNLSNRSPAFKEFNFGHRMERPPKIKNEFIKLISLATLFGGPKFFQIF
jgi:hypothetical protein